MKALSVALAALVLSACGEADQKMRAEVTEANGLKLISESDNQITVTRIVVNGREHEAGCDTETGGKFSAYPYLPVTIKRGEAILFANQCGDIQKVDVETDQGSESFTFGE